MGRRIFHIFIDGIESKRCSKCKQALPIDEYYASKITSDRLRSTCIGCDRRGNAAAYAAHPEYHQARIDKWKREHPERMAEINRERWLSDERKAWQREYRKQHPEKVKESTKRKNAKYTANGYWAGKSKERRQGPNRNIYLAMTRRSTAKIRMTAHGVIDHRMETALRLALKGRKNNRKWCDLVGYSVNDLISRLNETMPDGYSWDRINELHIDHIRPKSLFHYESVNDDCFRECWALENLQLLPAIENLKKNNRMESQNA